MSLSIFKKIYDIFGEYSASSAFLRPLLGRLSIVDDLLGGLTVCSCPHSYQDLQQKDTEPKSVKGGGAYAEVQRKPGASFQQSTPM